MGHPACDGKTGSIAVIEFELAPEAVCIMCVDLCKTNLLLKSLQTRSPWFPVRVGPPCVEAPVSVTRVLSGPCPCTWLPSVLGTASPSPDLHPEYLDVCAVNSNTATFLSCLPFHSRPQFRAWPTLSHPLEGQLLAAACSGLLSLLLPSARRSFGGLEGSMCCRRSWGSFLSESLESSPHGVRPVESSQSRRGSLMRETCASLTKQETDGGCVQRRAF